MEPRELENMNADAIAKLLVTADIKSKIRSKVLAAA
jgi:hypothetical protein